MEFSYIYCLISPLSGKRIDRRHKQLIMTPSSHANSVQTMINNPHAFVNLPAELLLQIGGSLASFHDVLEWSLTCRRFREVWLNNTTAIYKRIAPRCLDHEPLARMLLADQGGAPPDGVVSAKDVCRLLRNAKLVGYCCDYLNEWIVPGTTRKYLALYRTLLTRKLK